MSMKFAIFGSSFSSQPPHTEAQIISVCKALKERLATIYIHTPLLDTLSNNGKQKVLKTCIPFTNLPLVDVALSIGGDGTFLRTANTVGKSEIPVLGINSGRLGFLADINFTDIEDTLDELFSNNYIIEDRTILKVSYTKNNIDSYQFAINEVAILKQDTSSMLRLHTFIDNDFLTSYEADGLIIATPTGSTAYSLSVGGPILMPRSSSIALSPIAPHNLTSRPLVVNNDVSIRVKTDSRSNTYLVSTDGNSQVFDTSTEINICKATHTLKVIKRKGHTFYETLRDKLLWGVDIRK